MVNYVHKKVLVKEMMKVVSYRHIEVEKIVMKVVGTSRCIERVVKKKMKEEIYKCMEVREKEMKGVDICNHKVEMKMMIEMVRTCRHKKRVVKEME